ncbi:MAG: hypothetical protein R3E99_10185 [Burkholderiaceae bacterium]
MQTVSIPVTWQLAPSALNQPILPNWQFHLFNIELGRSSDPAIEQAALQKVGSYGRQIGHLAEVLEVLVHRTGLLDRPDLTQSERDAVQVFLGDVATIRQIKASPPEV